MIEVQQDLWTIDADWICITTNGTVKRDGAAVMGRGCALEAKQRFPGIDDLLGQYIQENGNIVQYIARFGNDQLLMAFPVKHHWRENADVKLIERSCSQLVQLYERSYKPRIALPRPGCGNGHLSWDIVKPICEYYFTTDDFIVVYK
jgi:hypothetical protein